MPRCPHEEDNAQCEAIWISRGSSGNHNCCRLWFSLQSPLILTDIPQLERGLELIKAGYVRLDGTDADLFDDDTTTVKKHKTNCYAGFTDAMWSGKTRGWATSACRLDSGKWTVILQATTEKMDWSGDDGDVDHEEENNAGAFDPRSLIEIC